MECCGEEGIGGEKERSKVWGIIDRVGSSQILLSPAEDYGTVQSRFSLGPRPQFASGVIKETRLVLFECGET